MNISVIHRIIMEQTTLHEPPSRTFLFHFFFSTQKLENIAKNGNHMKKWNENQPPSICYYIFFFSVAAFPFFEKQKKKKIKFRRVFEEHKIYKKRRKMFFTPFFGSD